MGSIRPDVAQWLEQGLIIPWSWVRSPPGPVGKIPLKRRLPPSFRTSIPAWKASNNFVEIPFSAAFTAMRLGKRTSRLFSEPLVECFGDLCWIGNCRLNFVNRSTPIS